MKNKSVLQRILTGLFVVLVLAASNSIVRAQDCPGTTHWTLDPINGGGEWIDGMNWYLGCVPTESSDASINNGGRAKIAGGEVGMAKSLKLGDNQGDSGSVVVTGDSAALELGTSSCRGDIYIGNRGSGNLTISNGVSTGGTVGSRYAYVAAVSSTTGSRSYGQVNVASLGVQGYAWYLYDNYDVNPDCRGAGLFIGCTPGSNGVGGTATVSISDNSQIKIDNHGDDPGIVVGYSGTLTGHGVISMEQATTISKTVKIFGTLAPSGLLNPGLRIDGKLDLFSSANTVFHVNANGGYDTLYVTGNTGEGHAHLDGRITVVMTGNFTAGTSFNLVNTAGLDETRFRYMSIISLSGSSGSCITPTITYDNTTVYLSLVSCALVGGEEDP